MGDHAMLVLGLGAIFVSLALMLATVGALTSERAQVNRSLAAVRALEAVPESMRREAQPDFGDRVLTPTLHRLTGLGRRLTPGGQAERFRHKLEVAGSPPRWDADRVLAFKALGLLALGTFGFFLPLALGGSALPAIGLAVVLGVLGYFAPDLWLYQRAYERSEQIQRTLPDALDLLTISVEAGLGFDSALAQVARNTEGPLAEEFFRVLQEMQIGLGRADAFRALSERTNVADLRNFVTAMIQADVFGIPIANVLRVQAREMRIKRTQRAEEQAQKVPVKILFPLIFCILPVLFVVVIGPAAISIVENFV
ncbi:MAG TPA: type II secretion system F family protein [Mycobacteriales bacterium]|jgi:tight adherence protein C|nr:type II secretion system F family protein [Mycobacteriales bacterium]